MKKIVLSLLIVSLITSQLNAQTYSWKVKANYPGTGNAGVSAFSINNKGYYFAGYNSSIATTQELWEYDAVNNAWTQKATFPGVSRVSASGFSEGNSGYVCGGWNRNTPGGNTIALSDLWQYDQLNNLWVQKTSFPATGRYNGSAFVIGKKAYYGLGYAPMMDDFYEYDILNDIWTPLVNAFPGGARTNANAFTLTYINQGNTFTRGFVGGGAYADNSSAQMSDYYSFTPGTTAGSGTWAQVSSIPGGRYGAFAFVINDKAYVGCGVANGNFLNDFYEYDPINDTWTAQQNFPVNSAAVKGFSIGSNGYAGTGTDGVINLAVFYEWSPGFVGINEHSSGNCYFVAMNNSVCISLEKQMSCYTLIYIYDTQGRLIAQENIQPGTTPAIVDMSQKNNGMYFIEAVSDKKLLLSAKFYKK